jgi:hypothetical protein
MERYVYRRRSDGIFVFNLGKTWEKLQLAARIIVAIENPQDIVAISARPYGQRAVLKFANYTGARATVGRHTPGAPLRLRLPPLLAVVLALVRVEAWLLQRQRQQPYGVDGDAAAPAAGARQGSVER